MMTHPQLERRRRIREFRRRSARQGRLRAFSPITKKERVHRNLAAAFLSLFGKRIWKDDPEAKRIEKR